MNTEHRFEIPDHVVSKKLGDELVLLDLSKGSYFGLDDVGARIWELLTQGHSIDQIADQITQEFAVDRETCAQDAADLIRDLLENKLIAKTEPN